MRSTKPDSTIKFSNKEQIFDQKNFNIDEVAFINNF